MKELGATYSLSSNRANMKEGWQDAAASATQYNYPKTSLDPNTSTGFNRVKDVGGVNTVKQTYDKANRIANNDNLSNSDVLTLSYISEHTF